MTRLDIKEKQFLLIDKKIRNGCPLGPGSDQFDVDMRIDGKSFRLRLQPVAPRTIYILQVFALSETSGREELKEIKNAAFCASMLNLFIYLNSSGKNTEKSKI